MAIAPLAQILAIEIIIVLSTAFEATDDLGFPMVAPVVEDIIEHSFNKGGSLGYSLKEEEEEVDVGPKPRALRKKKAAGVELAKRPVKRMGRGLAAHLALLRIGKIPKI